MTLEELKRRKNEMGYTYAQMAKMTGVPLGTIQKIFTGETANPRYDTMQALEQLFEDPDSLQEKVVYSVEGEDGFTIDDYLNLPDDQKVELIDGFFYEMSTPDLMHQEIVFGLGNQLQNKIEDAYKVYMSPVNVQLDGDDNTMILPDIMILCDMDKRRKWGIMGAPDFVLEVVNPATRNKDYAIKAAKYFKAKVREYWIVDPYQMKLMRYEFEDGGNVEITSLEQPSTIGIFDKKVKIYFEKTLEIIKECKELED